jgi:hypothetical protein
VSSTFLLLLFVFTARPTRGINTTFDFLFFRLI